MGPVPAKLSIELMEKATVHAKGAHRKGLSKAQRQTVVQQCIVPGALYEVDEGSVQGSASQSYTSGGGGHYRDRWDARKVAHAIASHHSVGSASQSSSGIATHRPRAIPNDSDEMHEHHAAGHRADDTEWKWTKS